MILKQKFCLKILDCSFFSSSKKFRIPLSTKEAGVSPGCTLEVIKIVGLSNLKGLYSFFKLFSGNSPSISSSLSVFFFEWSDIVINSNIRFSML